MEELGGCVAPPGTGASVGLTESRSGGGRRAPPFCWPPVLLAGTQAAPVRSLGFKVLSPLLTFRSRVLALWWQEPFWTIVIGRDMAACSGRCSEGWLL